MFLIKANAPINTEMYSYAQTQMASGKIQFLIDEATAKTKLMSTKKGQNMSPEQRNDELRPFVLTTALKAQLLNLVESNDGVNIILKQDSRGIPKDKFSAFIYGLYWIKKEEERLRKRKNKGSLADLMLFTTSNILSLATAFSVFTGTGSPDLAITVVVTILTGAVSSVFA